MEGDVLQLFEGLTEKELKEFRKAIIPELQKLRRKVVRRLMFEKIQQQKQRALITTQGNSV
jgi:hypothetical protein